VVVYPTVIYCERTQAQQSAADQTTKTADLRLAPKKDPWPMVKTDDATVMANHIVYHSTSALVKSKRYAGV
jgi:hypothetical protein